MYYYDWTYFIIVVPVFILAMVASGNVKSTFRKYAKIYSASRITGAEAAERVLRGHGVTNVRIEQVSGSLTDNYDPRNNVIHLSQDVYSSTSVAAIGVAAHEAGHACQYAQDYAPVRLRMSMVKVCSIGANLSWPAIVLGLILSLRPLIILGVILFSLSVLFQLVTLPVEFDASKRAIAALDSSGLLTADELDGAKKVLRAAAMTYLAALAVSVASLLRMMLLFGRRNNNR